MREAFGFPRAPAFVGALVEGTLRARGKVLRFFPPRRKKGFITTKPQRTWPNGYKISDLGPPPLLEQPAVAPNTSVGQRDATEAHSGTGARS
jgi:hypothetical protein